MGGGTAAAGDAVNTVGELVAVHVALAGVGTVGADEIQAVLGVGNIQAQAHALLQGDGGLTLVDEGHVAGDDVGLGEDGVVEVQLTARDRVVQDHFQRLGVLIRLGVGKLTVDGGVDGYAALVLLHLAEGELGGVAPRGEIPHTDGGGAEVAHAEGGELGGDGGGHVAVAVLGVVGGEGTAPGAVGQVGATGLLAVIQVDGKAIREDTQGVHGVLGADDGLGGDLGVLRVGDGDGHGLAPYVGCGEISNSAFSVSFGLQIVGTSVPDGPPPPRRSLLAGIRCLRTVEDAGPYEHDWFVDFKQTSKLRFPELRDQ